LDIHYFTTVIQQAWGKMNLPVGSEHQVFNQFRLAP